MSEQRSAVILKEIETRGSVSVANLSAGLGVSEMTIRRDLVDLEKAGFVRRVYGGAVCSRGRSYEPSLVVRSNENRSAKEAIGRRAASLVASGDSIAIDSGTTALEFAQSLVGRQNLTVVTPSLLVANVLSGQQGIKLVLTGGIVRPGEGSLVGDLAEQAWRGLFVDRLFLGVGAVDPETGLSEYNWDDALVKRAMVHSAKEVIVLADASKFGRVAFAQIAPLSAVHQIVTDQALSLSLAEACAKHGIVVHVTENEEKEGYDQNTEED